MNLARSSIMMDIESIEVSAEEAQMLQHPLVGGVILFSRNFVSSLQLIELTTAIRLLAKKSIIIGVDHEGGRVQRFRKDGFTHLPAMGKLQHAGLTAEDVESLGWLMASECIAHGIDISFAPVLDLDRGSDVVGDRAFSSDINTAVNLAGHWCEGMKQAGMACVGKHFPGHGSTKEDSHVAAPSDNRTLRELFENDLHVFEQLFNKQTIDAVMPAHIQFSQVDNKPAGYSSIWLQQILKQQLKFDGVIFSDDLSMVGAGETLTYSEKAKLALDAGCDMVLMCNNKDKVQTVLENNDIKLAQHTSKGIELKASKAFTLQQLQSSQRWQYAYKLAKTIITKE